MDTQTQPTQPTLRRNTRQRQLVLDAVRVRCDHPTAEDVYRDVHAIDEHVSRGTVYRNLNLLAETGVITTVKAPGARCASTGVATATATWSAVSAAP